MTLNLVQHRTGPSIWESQPAGERDSERWLLGVIASALIVAGVRRGATAGAILSVGGSMLAWWAATGIETRRVRRAQLTQAWPLGRPEEPVDEASEESFPASDAPALTPTGGNR